MSNQGYYQGGPQYPPQSYGQGYPQQGYPQQGYPPQQYGPPQGGYYQQGPPMQYQQGPPQQVQRRSGNKGCLEAWMISVSRLFAAASLPKKGVNAVPTAASAQKAAAKERASFIKLDKHEAASTYILRVA